MREHSTPRAVVDVCDGCGGVWIDWFDGELSTAVRGAELPVGRAGGEEGRWTCPTCRKKLVDERYDGDGPTISRCGSCAGAFVERSTVEVIVALGPPDAQPREDSGMFGDLVRRIESWLTDSSQR